MFEILNTIFQGISTKFSYFLFSPSEDNTMKKCLSFKGSDWEKYFKLKIDSPEIPKEILEAMEKPCPFWPNRLVKETHILCLIPKNLTLEDLENLIDSGTSSSFMKEVAGFFTQKSYWILITKKVIPNTAGLTFEWQKRNIAKHNYNIPNLLEAAIAVLAAKLLANISLFPRPGEFTRCNEESNKQPVSVGSDLATHFGIYTNDWNVQNGIAGILRA